MASAKKLIAFTCNYKSTKVRKITKRRKMTFLLNKRPNIRVVAKVLYLKRWSRIFDKLQMAFMREWKITEKLQKL